MAGGFIEFCSGALQMFARFRVLTLLLSMLLSASSLPAIAQQESAEMPEAGGALRKDLERQVSESPPRTDDAQELCVFFHKRGVANGRLGRYAQAIPDLREALRLNQANRRTPDDWGVRWRILNDLHDALVASGDLLGALQLMTIRVQEFPQALTPLATARSALEISLGQLSNAENSHREARRALEDYRRNPSHAPILASGWQVPLETLAAQLQQLRGNRVEGERFRRLAVQRAHETVAIASRLPPANIWRTRLAATSLRSATRGLAANLASQGRFGEAEYLSRQYLAETLAYASPQTTVASGAFRNLAGIRLQQGRLVEAEHWYRLGLEALTGAQVVPHSSELARARAELASALVAQARWREALSLFEERSKGLRSNPEQYKRIGDVHIDWALALLRTGDTEFALQQFRRMIGVHQRRAFSDAVYVAQLRGYLGVALGAQGKADEAHEQFRQSLPVLLARAEEDATNETGGFVGLYRLRTIIEGYLELLGRCHAGGCKLAGIDPAAEAFRMADVARGSAVQRAVTSSVARASLPDPKLLELARKEQTTTNRIQSLRKVMERLASGSADQRLNTIIADMQRDIAQLEAEQKAQRKELADRYPEYANLVDPQPAELAHVQRVLRPDEAAVAIYVAEKQTYVWTLTSRKTAFRTVAKVRDEVAKEVAHLRSRLEFADGAPRPFDSARAHEIYRLLLAEDAALWSNFNVLNVIPHGPLGQLPFSMLLTEPADNAPMAEKPWLIRKVAIAQLPSANAFLALRRTAVAQSPTQPLVGFGDPVFSTGNSADATTRKVAVRSLAIPMQKDEMLDLVERAQKEGKAIPAASKLPAAGLAQTFALLPSLPDTADELKEIAQALGADATKDLYVGSRATEKNVKGQDLAKYRVVAFATHGLVPGELPGLDQPALALSNPQLTQDADNDGFLTMEEVLALQLNADWVVLSACNTAGSDGQASEAVSGLGRAFFYAGARSLLVSNWPVETVSTRLLTTGLLRSQASNANLGRAEALRQSMLEVMSKEPYAHPVFWAPFSLVGDGGR